MNFDFDTRPEQYTLNRYILPRNCGNAEVEMSEPLIIVIFECSNRYENQT